MRRVKCDGTPTSKLGLTPNNKPARVAKVVISRDLGDSSSWRYNPTSNRAWRKLLIHSCLVRFHPQLGSNDVPLLWLDWLGAYQCIAGSIFIWFWNNYYLIYQRCRAINWLNDVCCKKFVYFFLYFGAEVEWCASRGCSTGFTVK